MRRNRDINGNISYIEGSGIMSNLWGKLTSDTSKKLAKIAIEKAILKGSEKIGEKVGEKVGEKIGEKISKKNSIKVNDKIDNNKNAKKANITTELSGKKIVEFLQQYNKEPNKQSINKYAEISQKFDELIS